jgi:hypothetical protein
MNEAHAHSGAGAIRYDIVAVITRRAPEWPGLAAAPVFAVMALVTASLGGGAEPLCSAMQHGSLMGGMLPMYLLMSAVHLGPWLRLVSGRRSGTR